MRRTLKQSMVAVMLLALPNMALALDDLLEGESDDSTEGTTLVTNQSTVTNIIVDQVKSSSIERNSKSTQSATSFSGYAGAQMVYSDDIKIFNIPLGLDVGYGFGVEMNVPIVSVEIDRVLGDDTTNTGLGDISVGGNYHFGTPSSSGLSIVTLLYKTTTGDEEKYLGSGADAYTFSYKYSKLVDEKYTLHLLGSYTINNDYSRTTPWNTMVDIEYGDSYMVVMGGSMPCLLNDKITTSAKLTHFHADETTNKYQGGGEFKYGETDVTDLWVQWDSTELVSGVPLGFGIKIPLQNEVKNSRQDPDKTFSFYISAAGLF